MVVVHQLADVTDDLVLQQLQPLGDAEPGDQVGFQAHQFAAGPVDRVDLLLQPPLGGVVPDDRDHLHHAVGGS